MVSGIGFDWELYTLLSSTSLTALDSLRTLYPPASGPNRSRPGHIPSDLASTVCVGPLAPYILPLAGHTGQIGPYPIRPCLNGMSGSLAPLLHLTLCSLSICR